MKKVLLVASAIFISADILGMVTIKDESFIKNQLAAILGKDNTEPSHDKKIAASISLDSVNEEEISKLIEKRKKIESLLKKTHDELMFIIQNCNDPDQFLRIFRKLILSSISNSRSFQKQGPLSFQEKHDKFISKTFPSFLNTVNKSSDSYYFGETALSYAIKVNNEVAVKYLLDYGADVNVKNNNDEAPLLTLLRSETNLESFFTLNDNVRLNILKELLKQPKIDLNVKDNDGNTPLFFAIKTNNTRAMKRLLKLGADVNAKNNNGDTPLICAVKKRNIDMVKHLIECGADVNAKNYNGDTPLISLIKKKRTATFQNTSPNDSQNTLPNNAQAGDVPQQTQLSPGERAAREERRNARETRKLEIIEELLKHPNIDPNITDNSGNTALCYAESRKKFEVMKVLIFHPKIKINDRYKKVLTKFIEKGYIDEKYKKVLTKFIEKSYLDDSKSLIDAVNDNDLEMVKLLIKCGADANIKNENGETVLICAIKKRNTDIVKYLISHGADVNAKDNNGDTPLICAVKKKSISMVKHLIEHGADVNAKDNDGDTPLISLIKKKKTVSSQNASPSISQDSKQTSDFPRQLSPEEIAKKIEKYRRIKAIKLEIIEELLKHPNIDPNITDNDGNSALYHAILKEKTEITKALLDNKKTHAYMNDESNFIKFIEKLSSNGELSQYSLRPLINRVDVDSWLISAVCQNNFEKVKLFVECGADVNTEDENGDTLLIHACYSDYKIAEFLIENGADINKKNYDGFSPLKTALEEKRNDIINLLVQCNVDKEDLTIFDAAKFNCVPLTRRFIEENPNSVNRVDYYDEDTPLHYACYARNFDVIELLLKNNADIEKENIDEENPKTPLSIIKSDIVENPKIREKYEEILLQDGIYTQTLPAVTDLFQINTKF